MFSTRSGPATQSPPALVSPTLYISRHDLDTMVRYAQLAPGSNEINGYALVTQRGLDSFVVEPNSVFITEQEVQHGLAVVTPVGYLEAEDRGFAHSETENRLRLQWHSHVWGTAVHSGTDLGTADKYGSSGNVDWMFWLVLNRHGDALVRLEQYRPFRMGMPVELHVIVQTDADREAAMLAEIQNKVTVVKPPPYKRKRTHEPALVGTKQEGSA